LPSFSKDFWSGKKVLVTGGTGFIGSFVVEKLLALDVKVRVSTRRIKNAERFLSKSLDTIELVEADLEKPEQAVASVKGCDIVMHLAATVGGIEYNIKHPASIFRDNMKAAINVLEACRVLKIKRTLITSSACVYPRHCSIPTPEEEGFKDRPEPTNEGYGWSKRMQEFLGESYAKEFSMEIAIARPYNCYGPRDNFNPESSHVIPALIRRIWKAQENPLKVWGSGRQSRSFLYVDDFADGLILTTEKYAKADAVNIGNDQETTIQELVELLNQIHKELGGKGFDFVFDTSKPEGQPRRRCDVTKAKEVMGYKAKTPIYEGLKQTVQWYLDTGMKD